MKNKKQPVNKRCLSKSGFGAMVLLLAGFILNLAMPATSFALVTGGVKNGAFSIAPHLNSSDALIRSWITYKAPAGAKIEDAVDIENVTGNTIVVNLFQVDAANADQKNFKLHEPTDPKLDIAKWMKLDSKEQITLKPYEVISIPMTIIVPEETTPAEYWGAVLAEETNASQSARTETLDQQKQTRMLIKTRLGIRTMVQVVADKNTPVERLLLATKPNIPENASGVSCGAKIYLGVLLTYFLLFAGWFLYEKFNQKRKLGKLLQQARLAMLGFAVLLLGLLLVLPNNMVKNISTSVLGGGGRGLSIMPVFRLNDSGDVTDKPSWFIMKGAAGDVLTGKAKVENDSDNGIDVKVTGVDGVITAQGGFALEATDNEQKSIGSWITVDEPKFRLDAHGTKEVGFSMKLPNNVEPGDHAGGVVVEADLAARAAAERTTTGMTVATRVGARIYLTVAGDVKFGSEATDFKLTQDDDDMWTFSYTMKNTGNVRFKPTLSFDLRDSADQSVKTFDAPAANEFFPGTSANVKIPLPWKRLEEGKYKLIVNINDTQNTVTQNLDLIVDFSRPVRKQASDDSHAAAGVPVAVAARAGSPVLVYIIIALVLLLVIVMVAVIVMVLKKAPPPPPAVQAMQPVQPVQPAQSGPAVQPVVNPAATVSEQPSSVPGSHDSPNPPAGV